LSSSSGGEELNAFDHAAKSIAALGGDMLLEVELSEDGLNVVAEDFRGGATVIGGLKDGDETANDIGVAVGEDLELCIGAVAVGIGNEPNLTLAAVHAVGFGALLGWEVGEIITEFEEEL
jgi:hypothetical protein